MIRIRLVLRYIRHLMLMLLMFLLGFISSSSIHLKDQFLPIQTNTPVENVKLFSEIDTERFQLKSDFDQRSKLNVSSTSTPKLWLDSRGDVRWNFDAQAEFFNQLLEKQFPLIKPSDCATHNLFLLEQWPMGFFSRFHCFIEQFGQTLYSSGMVLLLARNFFPLKSTEDDFLSQGIKRYFQPFSLCDSFLDDPSLETLRSQISNVPRGLENVETVTKMQDLFQRSNSTTRFKYSREIWTFSYEHIPHRRWLFDKKRNDIYTIVRYDSSPSTLADHSNENIHCPSDLPFDVTQWRPRNSPQGLPRQFLPGTKENSTVEDQIFTGFLRYMFVLFFSRFPARIEMFTRLLKDHWSSYLSDKLDEPYQEVLKSMAAIYIRRGDKKVEDSFWLKHKRWRNISMYVKPLVDEEKRRKTTFKSIFVLTDDVSAMDSIREYALHGLTLNRRDERFAREHLYRREILFNVLSPGSCSDPFTRFDFDQFMTSINFIINYATFVIGHSDSNVGRYLEEMFYVKHQLDTNIQSNTFVVNAPDSLD